MRSSGAVDIPRTVPYKPCPQRSRFSSPRTDNTSKGGSDMSTAANARPAAVRKSFDSPDETRSADKTRVEVVDLGGVTAMRGTFGPGWRWSECVKPVAGTESCQVAHLGYVASGRMAIRMD